MCVCTFRNGVQIVLLTHGCQQWQSADIHSYFSITVVLPRVVLHHVQQPSHQVQHTLLRVVLHTHTKKSFRKKHQRTSELFFQLPAAAAQYKKSLISGFL